MCVILVLLSTLATLFCSFLQREGRIITALQKNHILILRLFSTPLRAEAVPLSLSEFLPMKHNTFQIMINGKKIILKMSFIVLLIFYLN